MGTIIDKLNYTKQNIKSIYSQLKGVGYNITYGTTNLNQAAKEIALTTEICNTASANAAASNIEKGYTAYVKGKKITGTLAPKAGNLVNSVTFEGTYASSSYYDASNSGCCINPDTGKCIIYVKGGTSTAYESIRFDNNSIPTGAIWGPQSYYEDSAMDTGNLYSVLISNITYPIDVVCNFSSRNASYDYVYADITITKA